ncbi:hypothetical protein ACFLT9_01795 [Acidobacteriota bacterium]
MTKRNKIYVVCFLFLMSAAPLISQTIPFDSERWEINANVKKVQEFKGKNCLVLKGGVAVVKDSDFLNGIIEYDVLTTGTRGFMGAVWRLQDLRNYEEFYIRPHQSGNVDANQYTPVFNGMAGWQLYHGQGYGAAVKYKFNEWIHFKIVISGKSAEVYMDDMDKPLLFIPELKHDLKSGKVGIEANDFSPAYFANFSFKNLDNPPLKKQPKSQKAAPQGTVRSWRVSNPFSEKTLKGKYKLSSEDKKNLTWKVLETESSGTANLAKIALWEQGKDTVFCRVTIVSDADQIKKISFGYSDRIKVYLNDNMLYGGTNLYRSRDYRYLGTIGYFDDLFLPLKKGENTLWMAVSESFGGWGIKAQLEDTKGISIKID